MKKKSNRSKHKKSSFKKSDRIYFYLVAFIFGFLPALGVVLVAGLNTGLIVTIFPKLDPYFHPISMIIYILFSVAVFFISGPKATLFRKNFAFSAMLNFIVFFLINPVN